MLDYSFTRVSKYDGTAATERAIEVFNCATGTTLAIVRQRFMERKADWIARALEQARMSVA